MSFAGASPCGLMLSQDTGLAGFCVFQAASLASESSLKLCFSESDSQLLSFSLEGRWGGSVQ